MTDYSGMSDEELQAAEPPQTAGRFAQPQMRLATPTDYSKLTDEELKAREPKAGTIAGLVAGKHPEPQTTVGGTLAALGSGAVQGLGQINQLERYPEYLIRQGLSKLGVQDRLAAAMGNSGEGVMTAGFHEPQNTAERIANVAGNVAGSVPVYAGAEGLAAPMAMAGLIGGSEAGAKGGGAGDVALGAGLGAGGAGLGYGAGRLFSRLITPHPTNAAQQGMADTLEQAGVPITAGTRTGSKALRYKESVLGQQIDVNPDTMQQQGLARAGMRATGQDSGIDPGDLQAAYQRIGYEFDRIAGRNNLTVDPQLRNDLTRIATDYHAIDSPLESNSPDVNAIIQHIGQPGRVMGGPEYSRLRSLLSYESVPSNVRDNRTAEAMGQLREALDDAFERSVENGPHPFDAGELRPARQQYRNLLVMTKAVNASGEGAGQGMLSPAALANAAKSVYGQKAYATGQGGLTPLAQGASGTMKPLPQSGTAPRQNVLHDIGLAAILGGTGAAGGEYANEKAGDPFGLGRAAPMIGAMAGVLGQKALTGARAHLLFDPRMQAYLGNRVLSPQTAGALTAGGTAAGAALAPAAKPKIQDLINILTGNSNAQKQ